jgi:hypothetical protein
MFPSSSNSIGQDRQRGAPPPQASAVEGIELYRSPDDLIVKLPDIASASATDKHAIFWTSIDNQRGKGTDVRKIATQIKSEQIASIFLIGRDQTDSYEVEARIAHLPFKDKLRGSNTHWRDRVVAGFRYDPTGEKRGSVNQYTDCLRGLDVIMRPIEEEKNRRTPQDQFGVVEVANHILSNGGIAAVAEIGKKGETPPPEGEQVELDERRVRQYRAQKAGEEFASDASTSADDEDDPLDGIILGRRIGGALKELQPALLRTAGGQAFLAEYARPDASVDLFGDTHMVGTTCVGADGSGRRQMIIRPAGIMTYVPTGVPSGVVVEVEPRIQIPGIELIRGDTWVRPNERPDIEVNIADADRRIAFSLSIYPAEHDPGTPRGGFAYLEVATSFAKSQTRESKRVKLMRAAAWPRDSQALPLYVDHEKLNEAVRYPLSFGSNVRFSAIAKFVETHSDDLKKIAAAKPAKGKKAKQGVPVVALKFNPRNVAVYAGRFSFNLRHDPGQRDVTACRDVEVSPVDWEALTRAIAKLRIADDKVRLEVWPTAKGGILCLTASTQQATFRIWVPLLNVHDKQRSNDLLTAMELMPWPSAEDRPETDATAAGDPDGEEPSAIAGNNAE